MRTHPVALGALLLSLTACQADRPGGLFFFALGPLESTTPVAIAATPSALSSDAGSGAPTDASGATPVPPAAGGSGGSVGPAVHEVGTVLDAWGRPLPGAAVTGQGRQATVDAAGAFSIAATGRLTATLAGYTSQTLSAPYEFRLPRMAHEPGASYMLIGATQPPTPGARVLFVDAAGTTATTVAATDGSFSMRVDPRAEADTPGLVAVVSALTLPIAPRFEVQQVATPRLGALRVPHPSAGMVTVPVTDATGLVSLAPAAAPDAARETTLQVVDETGLSVPIGSAEGDFPATLPTFALPGLHLVVTLSSNGPDGESSVERADPAPGETWRPTWLAMPQAAVVGDQITVAAGSPVALSLRPESLAVPVWESIAAAGTIAMPPRGPGAYALGVIAFDGAPSSIAGAFGGATTDRRSATTRVTLPAAE